MTDADALRLLRLEASRERKSGPSLPPPGLVPHLEGLIERLWVRAQRAEALDRPDPVPPPTRRPRR